MTAQEKYMPLPDYLENFRGLLEQSALEYIKMRPSPTTPTVTQSKIGGIAYSPKGTQIPKDLQGEHMLLLAQINFSESTFPEPFPSSGLLQFFISPTVYAQASDITGFISGQWYNIRFLDGRDDEEQTTNIRAKDFELPQLGLIFSKEIEPVSLTDYRFSEFISPQIMEDFIQQHNQSFDDIYEQAFSAAEQKIGGYPYFITEDFRATQQQYHHADTLLLQLVSDDAVGLMWGDSGVLKFFIAKEDLVQQNFSKVLFYSESY